MPSYSITENLRINLSRIAAVIFFIIILITASKWEDISFISNVFFSVGCIFVGIASLGRLWCSLYIAGYKNEVLVDVGPYSMTRNPLYFFSMIGFIGIGLATETLSVPTLFLILFICYYPSVIKSEERRLKEIHNEKYKIYYEKTPSFFPEISLLNEPDTYKVNPKIFKKNMFGALWFVWAMGIIEFCEALHEAAILPIFFRIY